MLRALAHRSLAVLAVAGTALALVSPSAGAATDPKKWGATFCGELSTWGATIVDGGDDLEELFEGTSLTPASTKSEIVTFLDEAAGATGEFGDALSAVGAPKVKHGAAIQAAILGGIAGVEALLADVSAGAGQLPTADAATFKAAAAPLLVQLDEVAAPFEDAMDDVASLEKKKELSKVMRKVKACRDL